MVATGFSLVCTFGNPEKSKNMKKHHILKKLMTYLLYIVYNV